MEAPVCCYQYARCKHLVPCICKGIQVHNIIFPITVTAITLKWREGEKAPFETFRLFDSVIDGDTVYLQATDVAKLYSYTTSSGWSSLPDCPYVGSGLAVINHLLTTIGGNVGSELTNKLFSLTGEGSDKKWMEVFLPMQTERREMTALCTGTSLIVAGGIGIAS